LANDNSRRQEQRDKNALLPPTKPDVNHSLSSRELIELLS